MYDCARVLGACGRDAGGEARLSVWCDVCLLYSTKTSVFILNDVLQLDLNPRDWAQQRQLRQDQLSKIDASVIRV